MALSPIEALLRIQGERQDVQKALAPSMYQVGKKMGKKGKKAAWGAKIGEHALPFLADLALSAALNAIAPGMGSLYAAAKKVPVLKAAGKGTLAAYGHKLGGEFAAGQVGVPDTEKLMKKYLGETASGTQAMRFGRGAVESIEGQKGLQLEALEESIRSGATTAGLKTAGQSLLGDLSKARKTRIGADAGGGPSDILSDIRKGKGDLSADDYLTAITEGGREDVKSLFDISPIQEELGKGRLFQTGREARRMAADVGGIDQWMATDVGDIEQWYSGDHDVQKMPGMDEYTAQGPVKRLEMPSPIGKDVAHPVTGESVMDTYLGGMKSGESELAMQQLGLSGALPQAQFPKASFGTTPSEIMRGPQQDISDLFPTPEFAQAPPSMRFQDIRKQSYLFPAPESVDMPDVSRISDESIQGSMSNLGLLGSTPTPEQLDPSIAQARPIFATSRGALDMMGGDTPYKKSIGYGKLMDTLGQSQMKRAEGLSDARTAQMWKQFLNPNLGNQPRSPYTKTGTGFLPNLGGNWRGY